MSFPEMWTTPFSNQVHKLWSVCKVWSVWPLAHKENLNFRKNNKKTEWYQRTQKAACTDRTMVKLFLRKHLGCFEECQILINTTTQKQKAFGEMEKKACFVLTLIGRKGILTDESTVMQMQKRVKDTRSNTYTWPHVLPFLLLNKVT